MPESVFQAIKRYRIFCDDIFISVAGTLGIVGKVPPELDGANLTENADRITDIRCSPDFLLYVLMSPLIQNAIDSIGTVGAQPKLALTRIRQFAIPLPPSEAAQRAIATALSDVDALLDGLERLIAKKRDLKQAALQQLLTGQTRLPGFHGEWEVITLGKIAAFFKGQGLPKMDIDPYGAEACIHYGELFTQYHEEIYETLSRTNLSHDCVRSVTNDVLMPTSDVTPRGLAKASCVLLDGVIIGGDILIIRADRSRVSGPFLSHMIRREETQILQLVTGTTVYHLYASDMKKFVFRLPVVSEQAAIVAVLADMDAEIATLKQRRDKTHALKQAMMQELLTGKTRLVAVGGAPA